MIIKNLDYKEKAIEKLLQTTNELLESKGSDNIKRIWNGKKTPEKSFNCNIEIGLFRARLLPEPLFITRAID